MGKYIHGQTKNPLFNVWYHMRRRCNDKNTWNYKFYGGRGIKVSDEWREILSFISWAENNGYKKGLQLDRIDNNGNYEPSNCRFVTRKENVRNMRNNVYLTLNSERRCVSEWAEVLNINLSTLWNRIRKGWTDKQVLLTPIKCKT